MASAITVGGDEPRPTTMVKFMCSHGGIILPRLGDGKLKYVGGETRMIAVPSNINFSELMKRLDALVDGDMVLKYQTSSEDLDALVSVRSDEDLRLMLDDFSRHGTQATPNRRAFLFPMNPFVLDNLAGLVDPLALQLRYVEAINGIFRPSTKGRATNIGPGRPSFSISTCTSPRSISPERKNLDSANVLEPYFSKRSMQRVQSSPSLSPSLCSLNNHLSQTNSISNQNAYPSHLHHNQNHHHIPHIPHPQPSPKPPQDYHAERASPASSHDLVRFQMGGNQFYAAGRYGSAN